jgi:hypothetical protein
MDGPGADPSQAIFADTAGLPALVASWKLKADDSAAVRRPDALESLAVPV